MNFYRAANIDMGIGLGWNRFDIRISNTDHNLRPIVYTFKINRQSRASQDVGEKPNLFDANNGTLTACILEQVPSTRSRSI